MNKFTEFIREIEKEMIASYYYLIEELPEGWLNKTSELQEKRLLLGKVIQFVNGEIISLADSEATVQEIIKYLDQLEAELEEEQEQAQLKLKQLPDFWGRVLEQIEYKFDLLRKLQAKVRADNL